MRRAASWKARSWSSCARRWRRRRCSPRLRILYRPYRPKRRTRASAARERGLEGLAHFLKEQRPGGDLQREAAKYVDPDKEVPDTAAAIAGAGDILAEELSDSARLRGQLRDYLQKNAQISTTTGTKENEIYQMYSEYSESIRKIPSHRVLAIDRGEREEALKVNVEADHEHCVQLVERELVRKNSPFAKELRAVCADSFERLIFPSLTRELRAELTERACKQAIGVFSENLKNLLMQPPVKGAVTLGFDPAYRTGCKIAVVDATGKVLETTVVYPTPPQNKTEEAKKVLGSLIRKHGVTVIAIGNGTASQGVGDLCGGTAAGAEPRFNEQGFLHGGQRGGGVGLLGLQAGGGGIPAVRRLAAQRGFHRAAAAGPAGGAGQDRPQGDRRRAVPARHAAKAAGRGAGRRGGGLRQPGRGGPEHRQRLAALLCSGGSARRWPKTSSPTGRRTAALSPAAS